MLKKIKEREEKMFKDTIIIERVINLKKEEFEFFEKNLKRRYDFIKDNKEYMYLDNDGTCHAILVTIKNINYGYLVQSDGTSYARYIIMISKEGLFDWPEII